MLSPVTRDEVAELGETISDSYTRAENEKRRTHGTPETPEAPTATVRRGEIWWYKHPDFKRRPALILGPDPAIDGLDYMYVVLATTTRLDLPTEIALSPQNGMSNVCFLAADQIDLAKKTLLTSPITTLGAETISEVSRALTSVPTR
jgi:mRNA-degrading endonuclease toxin of MazEF toxin-antitoxin module